MSFEFLELTLFKKIKLNLLIFKKGEFKEDKRNGQGKYFYANQEKYEGNWFHDFRHGYGKYQWYDSNVYFGMFFMNNREGFGHLMYSSGDDFKVNSVV